MIVVVPGTVVQVTVAYPNGVVSTLMAPPGACVSMAWAPLQPPLPAAPASPVTRRLRPNAPAFKPRAKRPSAWIGALLVRCLWSARVTRCMGARLRAVLAGIRARRARRAALFRAWRAQARSDRTARIEGAARVAALVRDRKADVHRRRVVFARMRAFVERARALRPLVRRAVAARQRAAHLARKYANRWRWRAFASHMMSVTHKYVVTHRVIAAMRDVYLRLLRFDAKLGTYFPEVVALCKEAFEMLDARDPVLDHTSVMLLPEEFTVRLSRFHHSAPIAPHMVHPDVNAIYLQIPSLLVAPLVELHACLNEVCRYLRFSVFRDHAATWINRRIRMPLPAHNAYIAYELKQWHANEFVTQAPARWAVFVERQIKALEMLGASSPMACDSPKAYDYTYVGFWLRGMKLPTPDPSPFKLGPSFTLFRQTIQAASKLQNWQNGNPKEKIRAKRASARNKRKSK